MGWTFDCIPVVWLLRRVPRRAGHAAPPAAGIHATTPVGGSAVVTHIGNGCRAAGFLPIAMAVTCTKLDRSGRARIADSCHRLVGQTSGATQRCLNPGFSERIGNSRRTGTRASNTSGPCLARCGWPTGLPPSARSAMPTVSSGWDIGPAGSREGACAAHAPPMKPEANPTDPSRSGGARSSTRR